MKDICEAFERRLQEQYNMEEQTNRMEESRENLDIFDKNPFDIGLDNFEMDFEMTNPFEDVNFDLNF